MGAQTERIAHLDRPKAFILTGKDKSEMFTDIMERDCRENTYEAVD